MRFKLLLPILLLSGCFLPVWPEPPAGADDDDAVDACAAAVPCTGDYIIQSSADMDDIALCESITGSLWFEGQGWLTSIDDLSCLTSVGEQLAIQYNDALTDTSGLSGITSVGGNLIIRENAALTNLDGLSGITTVGGTLYIHGNDALTDISGLSSLTTVGGALYIYNNPLLCQSLVDAFVAACSCGGVGATSGNDDGC